MKFFLDTANVDDIKEAHSLGLIDGVTTNPSLISNEGRSFDEIVKEIFSIVEGPISLETISTDADGMVKEGKKLAQYGSQAVIKVPITLEGLKATRALRAEGIHVNVTLCFSPTQALPSRHAGNYCEDYPEHDGADSDAEDGPTTPEGDQWDSGPGPEPATHERFVQDLFVGECIGCRRFVVRVNDAK